MLYACQDKVDQKSTSSQHCTKKSLKKRVSGTFFTNQLLFETVFSRLHFQGTLKMPGFELRTTSTGG